MDLIKTGIVTKPLGSEKRKKNIPKDERPEGTGKPEEDDRDDCA
jgi:hypothetical protein